MFRRAKEMQDCCDRLASLVVLRPEVGLTIKDLATQQALLTLKRVPIYLICWVAVAGHTDI